MSAPEAPTDARTDGPTPAPLRIVSGGQTGVDRGALDAALAAGAPAGGWCPRGRAAEDGPIPGRYPMRETAEVNTRERTRLNVRDSDATLIVAPRSPEGGTYAAMSDAHELRRPVLVVNPGWPDAADLVTRWTISHRVKTLNVAGPRESEWPDGYRMAFDLVAELLRRLDGSQEAART